MQEIIHEIFFNHISFIAKTNDKLIKTIMAVYFHYMPQNGLPPISTIGLGRASVSSEIRVPSPPAKMTTFIKRLRLNGANLLIGQKKDIS